MRYRWIAFAVILAGFVTITYLHNEASQNELLLQVAGPAQSMSASSDTYAWLDDEVASLRRMRALLDTLDAAGFRTDLGAELRTHNRASLEQMERLRLLTWLQDKMWRQTFFNLIWAVFGGGVLLPLSGWMDARRAAVSGAKPGEAAGPV